MSTELLTEETVIPYLIDKKIVNLWVFISIDYFLVNQIGNDSFFGEKFSAHGAIWFLSAD